MKQLYTSLLTGAALLVAGAVSAQSVGSSKLNPTDSRSLHAGSVAAAGHVAQAGHARGTAPFNDECSSVTALSLAAGGSLTFSGDNTGATITGDYEAGSALEGSGFPSVWHAFTTTECTDVTFSYCNSSDGFSGNFWIVIASGCPAGDANMIFNSSFEATTCANGTATINYLALPAGTYYVPVLTDEATGVVGAYSIDVTAAACPSAPANDECAGAISLTSGTNCIGTPFFTTGASESLPAILCEGFTSANALDVWFSFVCTSTTQTIAVVGPNEADAMVELFEGSCASPSSLGCADATFPQSAGETTSEQLIQGGLTVGTTYYVRVYDWGHASPDHYFEICVTEGSGTNIGIEENTTDADWSIYPNPGTGVFTIQYNGANTATSIEVIDITGRVVYTERTSMAAGTNHAIDLSGMAAGNYNVRLTANGVRTEQRLAVK